VFYDPGVLDQECDLASFHHCFGRLELEFGHPDGDPLGRRRRSRTRAAGQTSHA
jgi:hypothetical protein